MTDKTKNWSDDEAYKQAIILCKKYKTPMPTPLENPPFTFGDIKKVIPAECFKRSYFTSFYYFGRDILFVSCMFLFGLYVNKLPFAAQLIGWPIYWFMQGAVSTGLWVTAHECGHGGFSDSKTVNSIVGLLAHSFLLVPFHPWRISHGHHHAKTGSIDDDEVFVPTIESDYDGSVQSTYIVISRAFIAFVFGWPAYLIANITGPKKYIGKKNDHFQPDSALFSESQKNDVIISDIVLFSWIGALIFYFIPTFGIFAFVKFYFIPYLVVNFWLVLITFLQHTDIYMPHYRGKEWNYVRGALTTVDRDFGWLLNNLFHHITDTHVVHHLFSDLPFYNAEKATVAIKPLLGAYYLKVIYIYLLYYLLYIIYYINIIIII
jgi:omega-6 fatty acid desaturase / acyl-lipid omega-6 desaturase (Delta-12 desaturase)